MTTYRRNLLFSVEGMGNAAASSAGVAWNYGNATIASPGNYEIVGGVGTQQGLAAEPQSVAFSADRFACQVRGNPYTFRLHRDALAVQLWTQRPDAPRDALETALDEDDTSLNFAEVGSYAWSASDDDTVVWIGDEAIKLGSYAGSLGVFTGCTRGYWGTTAMDQPKGMNVFGLNPKVANRHCKLSVYDRDAGTITQAWQGVVTGYREDGPFIEVQTSDIWSLVSGAKINRRVELGLRKRTVGGVNENRQDIIFGSVVLGAANRYRQRVNKTDATLPHIVHFQIANAVIPADLLSDGGAYFTEYDATSSRPILGSQLSGELGTSFYPAGDAGEVYELMVVDRMADQAGDTFSTYSETRSSTRDLNLTVGAGAAYHPVGIAAAILTSTYATVPGEAPPLPSFLSHAWEATDLTTSDGGSVTTWTDSISAEDLVAPTGKKPTYRATAAASGLPSLDFGVAPGVSGANAYLDTAGALFSNTTDESTIIFVWEPDNVLTNQVFCDGTTQRQHFYIWSNNFRIYGNGGTLDSLASSSYTGGPYMIACVFDSQGAESFARVDGTKGTTGDAHSTDDGRLQVFRVGANLTPQYGLGGYLHAVYVAPTTLTDAQLDQMQDYCVPKWSTSA